MHRVCFLLFLFCFSAWPEATSSVHVRNALAQLPRSFEANQGQAERRVKYLARGPGYSVYLTATEVMIVSTGHPAGVLRIKLMGANRDAKIEPLDPLPGRSNYFIGSDPSKWRTNIQNYAKVALRGVYPGIDLIFYGNQQQLEYDAVVAPGADPNRIRLKFKGAIACRERPTGT